MHAAAHTRDERQASKPTGAPDQTTLPGPKKKQAEALFRNIDWLVSTFGRDRIGFLTLTVGDKDLIGHFEKIKDRKEAERRFNSLLTHVIRRRYRCGVIVTERHKDGGIHYHLVTVHPEDIRGNIDFEACFPKKTAAGGYTRPPDYRTAPEALREEWAFWRERADKYGFGRCQLQPIKANGEALGRYVGKYISKSWEHRRPEDKGARCVRYFGNWKKTTQRRDDGKEIKFKAPWSFRHGAMTPWSRAWRECAKQVQLATAGAVAPDTVKQNCGRHWAFHFTKKFNATLFLDQCTARPFDAPLADALKEHNYETAVAWLDMPAGPAPVWERSPLFWLWDSGHGPEPDYKQFQARRENSKWLHFDAAARDLMTLETQPPHE